MKIDFYNDPEMKHGVDWRRIAYKMFGTHTLDGVTIEGTGQEEYVLQSKIEGGWQDEYFCCMNGERLHEGKFQWQLDEAKRNEFKDEKVIDPMAKMLMERRYPKYYKLLHGDKNNG